MQDPPRFVPPSPIDLSAAQAELAERIAGGPRRSQAGLVPVADDEGRLIGPFALMTIVPGVGDAVQALGTALRFSGILPARVRELGILQIACARGSDFEWFAHERAALAAGAERHHVAAVLAGAIPSGLSSREESALRALAALVSETFDAQAYETAVMQIGIEWTAELVWLVGYYSMIALALAALAPPLPPDAVGALARAAHDDGYDEPGAAPDKRGQR